MSDDMVLIDVNKMIERDGLIIDLLNDSLNVLKRIAEMDDINSAKRMIRRYLEKASKSMKQIAEIDIEKKE